MADQSYPLVTIFNGRWRGLGGEKVVEGPFAQVHVGLVGHLHEFSGSEFKVFMAIALHSNEDGWSWPSRATLARETGYTVDTVSRALSALCEATVCGHRVLLRYQPQRGDGTFASNRYLIFPTKREIGLFEHDQPELIGVGSKDLEPCPEPVEGGGEADSGGKNGKVKPCSDLPCTVQPCTVPPCTVQPCTENHYTNQNHGKQEPSGEQEPKQQADAAAAQAEEKEAFCSIHQVRMQRRSKDGDVWYSHKLGDGSWCKGAPGDQPGDAVEDDPRRQGVESQRRYQEWQCYVDDETEIMPCGRVLPAGATCPGGSDVCETCEFRVGAEPAPGSGSKNATWQAALAELQLQLTQATFDTWLRDSVLLREEDGALVVGVKNGYAKDWLEHRLLSMVKRTLARLMGGPVDVRFEVQCEEGVGTSLELDVGAAVEAVPA